ncbi:MAG: YoaK family protein [Pseudomonadota bacterium]
MSEVVETRAGTSHSNAVVLGAALGFIAGFADASTFVGADGTFCAHITGNLVTLAADFSRHPGRDQWLRLATLPVFVLAALGAAGLRRRWIKAPVSSSVRTLLLLNGALFVLVACIALATGARAKDPGAIRSTIVALLVVAMGVQNAIHAFNPGLGPSTTVMTGNTTRWFVEKVLPSGPDKSAHQQQLGSTIAAFVAGCACGAFGVVRIGFAVSFVPAIFVFFARTRVRESLR